MKFDSFYFFHIPKTAGTSTTHFLYKAFAPEQICPYGLWDQLIEVPREQLARWNVFSGHYQSHLAPYLGKELRTFTVLRKPFERTLSHYFHVRRAPEHPFHQHAQQLSVKDFCLHRETRFMVENYQSHWLAKSSIDPSVAAEEISAEERKRFLLQEKMHAPDHFRDMDELLKAAEKRLETFEAVGFAENLEESLHRISSRLGLAEPGKPVHANANPDPVRAEDLDTETTRVIQNLTQVDSELYKRALGSLH